MPRRKQWVIKEVNGVETMVERPFTDYLPEPDCRVEPLTTGDKVSKTGGDYRFDGTVVGVFPKLSGEVRYVVEDDRGCLHIYSEKNLVKRA
jgi:hypothetical protein